MMLFILIFLDIILAAAYGDGLLSIKTMLGGVPLTLKQIEYFQMVCAKGSISAAADELFISRSVISRTLTELESEFNTQLFVRSKNGVLLTESGQILAQLFKEMKAGYTTAKERIRQFQEGERCPVLRVGVTPTNAYRVHQLYLDAFRQEYPNIQLLVSEYSAHDADEVLLDGTVDALFTPGRTLGYNSFDSINLYQTQISLGVLEGAPIAEKKSLGISDILFLPLGYLNAPMPVESVMESCFNAFGETPNVVICTSDQILLRELTLRGIIYPIFPSDMLESWEGVKGIPLDFFPSSTHRLVWDRALPHDEIFDSFLNFIVKNTAKSK